MYDRFNFTGKNGIARAASIILVARYFLAAQGRFTSPDPLYIQKEMFTDPQPWNLYAYVRNNPLVYVDPTGKTVLLANCQDKQQCAQVLATAAQLPKGVTATPDKNGNLKLEGDHSKIKDRVRNTDPSRGIKIRPQDSPELIKVTDLPRITSPGGRP